MIFVIGGTIQEAQSHCLKNSLGYGKAVIMTDPTRMMGIKHDSTVHLVGSYNNRRDKEMFNQEFKYRGVTIEDHTHVS